MKKETMVKKKKKSKRKKCCKKVYKRNFAFGNNRKRRKGRKSSPRNILGKRKIKRKGNGYWKWFQVVVLPPFLRKNIWILMLKLFVINCMSILIPVYVYYQNIEPINSFQSQLSLPSNFLIFCLNSLSFSSLLIISQ